LKWRDVASVKIKLKVPATQHHRHKHPAPAHWRDISDVRFLFGLTSYILMIQYVWTCMWSGAGSFRIAPTFEEKGHVFRTIRNGQ